MKAFEKLAPDAIVRPALMTAIQGLAAFCVLDFANQWRGRYYRAGVWKNMETALVCSYQKTRLYRHKISLPPYFLIIGIS
ncbi:MAG: hypothetical protein KHW87_03900 [Clostridiales bacterium]|nr:hypothetical protein [Clostridiales bacterium]